MSLYYLTLCYIYIIWSSKGWTELVSQIAAASHRFCFEIYWSIRVSLQTFAGSSDKCRTCLAPKLPWARNRAWSWKKVLQLWQGSKNQELPKPWGSKVNFAMAWKKRLWQGSSETGCLVWGPQYRIDLGQVNNSLPKCPVVPKSESHRFSKRLYYCLTSSK